ncbi:ApeA N-terminal domain 1-containing protein [Methanobacterium lacus]|nr:HEPN domain-containing protein [Methanobacterium lacus]
MDDKIEFNGYWWFPNKPDEEKVFGKLEYVPGEGAILKLSDFSEDKFEPFDRDPTEPYHEIVLGLTSEGKKITLYKCHNISNSYKGGGHGQEEVFIFTLKVWYIFVGHHFENLSDIKLKCISIQYSNLDEWIDMPLKIDELENRPKSIPLTKMGDYKVFIDFHKSMPFSSFRKMTVTQYANIWIESFQNNKPWAEYENIIRSIQNFLTIAFMHPTYPLKIKGKVRKDKIIQIVDDDFEGPIVESSPFIDIYVTHSQIPKLLEEVNSYQMLFPFDEVKKDIKRYLLNWLVNSSLYNSVYNSYFSTVYNKNLFLENQFLNVIMALEGYHRSRTDNIEIDKYLHNKRVESIIRVAPIEHEKWLESQLNYSNEPSLRARLLNILRPYSDVFRNMTRIESFIYKVVTNRNSLVHKDKNNNIDYGQLFYTTVILKIVFELYLLEDMGFKQEYIKQLIEKRKSHYAFKYMKMVNI